MKLITSREEAREILEAKGTLFTGAWWVTATYMSCGDDGCCNDYIDSIEDALDIVESYSDNFKEKVEA